MTTCEFSTPEAGSEECSTSVDPFPLPPHTTATQEQALPATGLEVMDYVGLGGSAILMGSVLIALATLWTWLITKGGKQ